jgi:glycosyltransferase involved in cell wall biosynthesis
VNKPNDGSILLLYVGSINIQDGVRDLVKVVHILVNKFQQTMILCRVIGDGDDLDSVKELCEELKINKYFSFLGYVYDRETVRKHIVESDICLEPAPNSEVNSKSTFIKVMEYMAEGKPIVAFDMAETRFSADGAALMVEPGNHYAFAEAIMRLIGDAKLRSQLGEFGQIKINTELNWCNASRELYQAYRAIRINSTRL